MVTIEARAGSWSVRWRERQGEKSIQRRQQFESEEQARVFAEDMTQIIAAHGNDSNTIREIQRENYERYLEARSRK